MRPTSTCVLFAGVLLTALSGCHHHRRYAGLPPAYACDAYGCDDCGDDGYLDAYGAYGYGAPYGSCVDDGNYYPTGRGLRKWRRDERRDLRRHHGDRGGPPVVAAYLVPMDMTGGCGMGCCGMGCCGMGCCGMGCCGCIGSGWMDCGCCDECYPCEDCAPCGDCGPCDGPCAHDPAPYADCGPNGCQWHPQPDFPPPSVHEAYPYSSGEEGMLTPVPAPPVQEGPWNPPSLQSVPRSTPEPAASRPLPATTWLPANLR